MRNTTWDSLRGLAVLTMIGANFAGEHLVEPHPHWFRFFGTFAAPLFVTLSGAMVVIGTQVKLRDFFYFLKRGFWILMVAAFVDIFIWRSYPFTCMDVLYLIGVSLPIAYGFSKLPNIVRWVFIFGLVGGAIQLRSVWGYCDVPTLVNLSSPAPYLAKVDRIWRHWFIDVWFPLIPWLAFSWVGVQFALYRETLNKHLRMIMFWGMGFVIVGGLWVHHSFWMTRDGYSELFYPLRPSFFMLALGVMACLYAVFQRFEWDKFEWGLGIFGRHSLLMYVLHLVAIVYLCPQHQKLSFNHFMVWYAGLAVCLWCIALWVNRYAQFKKK